MTHPDDQGRDDEFARLLAGYDEALAQGETPPPSVTPTDGELDQRLMAARECLALLEQAWPRSATAVTAVPLPLSPDGLRELGRFQLRRELGRGGHGVVFLAFDPLLRRDVAVKLPRPEAVITDDLRRRFQREAEAAARLNHPNLVPIHEAGHVGPLCYLVTAYCPGPTLAAWLREQAAPVPPAEAARLVAALADAVAYMHGQGILHRDIKPGNILLVSGGVASGEWSHAGRPPLTTPKLTDFGLAKFTQDETQHTRTGVVLGTPAYMAPEQADSRLAAVGPHTDVYALGTVLYEMLTGRPPFQGENEAGTIRQVLNDEPPPPRRLRGDIPQDLETICLKCLEKEARRRYASAGELAKDLRAFLEGNSIAARPAGNWKRAMKWTRRHPARATWLLSAAVAIVTIVFGWLWYVGLVRDHGIDVQGALKRTEELRVRQEAYATQIARAGALQEDERDRLLAPLLHAELPGSSDQDVRGFEWHYLWAQALSRPRLLKASPNPSVQLSADGKWCASISGNFILRIWDVPTGRLREALPLEIGRDFIREALFSSDGTRLLCWASEHPSGSRFSVELTLWELPSGRLLVRRPIHTDSGNWDTLSISSDGRLVTYLGTSTPSSSDKKIRVWDTVTGDDRLVFPTALANAVQPVLSVHGKQLAVADCTGTAEHPGPQFIDIWDITTGRRVRKVQDPVETVNRLAFSPDGRSLATASYGQGRFPRVCLFDAQTGKLRDSVRAFSGGSVQMAFSTDSKTLAVGEDPEADVKVGPRVQFFDVATGIGLSRAYHLKSAVKSLSFSSDHRTMAVGCSNGDVALCDTSDHPAVAVVDMQATQGRPTCVAVSPNGNMYATGTSDGFVNLSDLKTGRLLGEWQANGIPVKSMAFLQEGRLATCASDGKGKADLTLWDVSTRTNLARLPELGRCDIGPLAVEPLGETIAFVKWDLDREEGSVGVWQWQTGQVEYLFRKQGARIRSVQISPDGRILAASRSVAATADDPNEIVLFELQEKRPLPTLPGHSKTIPSLTFSRYGTWKFLVSGSHDGSYRFWDLKRFLQHPVRVAPRNPIWRVAYSPDGRGLAVAQSPVKGEPASITLWEGGTFGQQGRDRFRPGPDIIDMAFAPDGQTIVVACEDRQVWLWQMFLASPPSILEVHGKKEAWSVAFSPDSQTLAVGYDDEAGSNQETLKLWDLRTGMERANLRHGSMVSEVAFLPHSSTLVSVCYDKALRLWDFETHKQLKSLYNHAGQIRCVAASPDGRFLASAGYDKVVRIWDAATGSVLHMLERHTALLHRVTFAPDSKTVASADDAGELRISDVNTGQEIRLIKDNGHLFGLAYAPSGTILATGNQDGVVKLHDLKVNGEPRSLFGHKGEVRFVTFSPDGKTLASGGEDRTVRLWHVATGRELLVFKDLPHKVNSVAFSPDGRHLAAAIHDGSVRMWHAARREE